MPSSYTRRNGFYSNGMQRFKADPDKYLFNIDTLWLNADAVNYEEVLENGLLERLQHGRERLLDGENHETIDLHLSGYENLLSFKILPGDPPLYQYSIRNEDIAIYFAKTRREKQLPMRIQINQFILWDKGLEKAYGEALCVLSALGFGYCESRLNRVDFAVHSDQWQWNLKDLEKFSYPRNIADDNKPNFWRLDPCTGNFETVYYGDRTRCQLRIYNKSIESKKKKKQYFLDLYRKLGMDEDNVWNVEIEVRRPFIKECKDLDNNRLFDNFDKVIEENRLADLWSYLMGMYSHPSAHWSEIKKGCPNKKFYSVDGYELMRQKDIDSNFERELAQISGRMELAVLNKDDYSLENAIKIFYDKYHEIEVRKKDRNFLKRVEKKKRSLHNNVINNTVFEEEKKLSKKRLYFLHKDMSTEEIEKIMRYLEFVKNKNDLNRKSSDRD